MSEENNTPAVEKEHYGEITEHLVYDTKPLNEIIADAQEQAVEIDVEDFGGELPAAEEDVEQPHQPEVATEPGEEFDIPGTGDPREDAEILVSSFCDVVEIALERTAKTKCLQPGDWKAHKAGTADQEQAARIAELQEYTESLEFSDAERRKLTRALERVLVKYNHLRMSPEMALIISASVIMAPRILPVWGQLTAPIKSIFRKKTNA